MDNLHNFPWCKPEWNLPKIDKEVYNVLRECANIPQSDVDYKLNDIIKNSKEFPVKFPIETVRLETLKAKRPVDRLKRNIESTYPILHERILILMARFIIYKRQFGSSIEKALYKDMKVGEFIDRLLKKRAITFMRADDLYRLITGENGKEGWESIGTDLERPPLILQNCLSYDEVKLSAMLFVSGYTECINDGARRNKGVVKDDNIEHDAVIIGIIGPRFKRKFRMEFEDTVIHEEQNCAEKGYGKANTESAKHMYRQMWDEFYEVPSCTYTELTSTVKVTNKTVEKRYLDRFVKIGAGHYFDNEVYSKRIAVTIDTALLDTQYRAHMEEKFAFLNVIGAGLGVWRASKHQNDVYVITVLERIQCLLNEDKLDQVSDVNLAYIDVSDGVLALLETASSSDGTSQVKKAFIVNKKHPKGGISVTLEKREPSSKLCGEHEGKLLVLTYAWDGNAHPGNEFWIGKLASSGDSAAACATQVSELHNAHINPAVEAGNTRVVCKSGLVTLQDYCSNLTGSDI